MAQQSKREEALARFQTALHMKQECLAELEQSMKAAYKERTGESADHFFALWWKDYRSSVVDAEGQVNYATIILRNDNPRLSHIIKEFTDTVQLLSQKPEED